MTPHDISQRRRTFLRSAGAIALAGALPASGLALAAGKPRIGIIGSGHVGSALGRAWAGAGYEVLFASRNLDADKKLAADVGARARAGTPLDAVKFGDVVLVAVPYSALPDLGRSLGAALKGKIVIDASNPFPQRDGEIADTARERGAGVVSAELLPGARIVRAFNAIGAARMGSVHEEPGKVGLPIAGDDAKAIEVASRVITDIGFVPVLVGGLDKGKYLIPGSPLAGEHSPDEIRKIAATLQP